MVSPCFFLFLDRKVYKNEMVATRIQELKEKYNWKNIQMISFFLFIGSFPSDSKMNFPPVSSLSFISYLI